MQEKDKAENLYFEDPEHFVDFINGYVYQGDEVLKKEYIRERKQVFYAKDVEKNKSTWSIIRDVVMETELEAVIILIGIENQNAVHYAMPLRVMKDDVTNYMEQWKKLEREHKKKKDLKAGAEYMSGLSLNDRLVPVVTFCIYWGEEEWDGPRSLWDMLGIKGISEEVKGLIADYPINLIEVNKFEHPEYFKTDLRIVFEFLQSRGNHKKIEKYIEEHEKDLKNISEETFDLLQNVLKLKNIEGLKEVCKNEKGGWDMCRALEEMMEIRENKARRQGRRQGIRLGKRNGLALAVKIIELHANGKSVEEIAKSCGIALGTVQKLIGKM